MFSMPQKKAPYHKIRLQNICFIISNRVQMFSMPQKKAPYHKIRLHNICFIISNRVQMFSMPQKKAQYHKIRLHNVRFIMSNRVQMFSMPQKKPNTTKSDFTTSALSCQIESKCFLCLKKSPIPQNPTSKHPLHHVKSSPNVFYASKKAPYHKIRLHNIRFIISNRVQMFCMPEKKTLTTKSDFKESALSLQIESKCFLCLKKGPLPQNPI